MSGCAAPSVTEVTLDDIKKLLDGAKDRPLDATERERIWDLAVSYFAVLSEIQDKKATIKSLRDLVFGASTETKATVLGEAAGTPAPADGQEAASSPTTAEPVKPKPKPKPKGHGRKASREYTGANRVSVPHELLRPGDQCPRCGGTLYGPKKPAVILRIIACAPFTATVYEKERLRCGDCQEIFVASSPPGVGEERYDASVPAMLGNLRFGSGLPMTRIAALQESVGVPLPVSTQWELLLEAAGRLRPLLEALVRLAAQAVLFYNDDTPMRILSYIKELNARRARGEKPERTGIFTSGIVAELSDGRLIVLYYTGLHHAGENLAQVLMARSAELDAPMQMCDALDRNLPEPLKTILGNCLVHARRLFVKVNESFPAEVRHVIEELALVYQNEARAKSEGMSQKERLLLHQEASKPVMDRLKTWMDEQIAQKKTEPNSVLGNAIEYSRKRWDRLTLFLRQEGAPLDNNLVERMLKRAILHRKNSLFYKTQNGAMVGDLFMSLIATAKQAKVDPFNYLTELLRHPKEIAASPSDWFPWNYRQTLERARPAT